MCVYTIDHKKEKKNKQTTGTREKKKKGWCGVADRLYVNVQSASNQEIFTFFCPQ